MPVKQNIEQPDQVRDTSGKNIVQTEPGGGLAGGVVDGPGRRGQGGLLPDNIPWYGVASLRLEPGSLISV